MEDDDFVNLNDDEGEGLAGRVPLIGSSGGVN